MVLVSPDGSRGSSDLSHSGGQKVPLRGLVRYDPQCVKKGDAKLVRVEHVAGQKEVSITATVDPAS